MKKGSPYKPLKLAIIERYPKYFRMINIYGRGADTNISDIPLQTRGESEWFKAEG